MLRKGLLFLSESAPLRNLVTGTALTRSVSRRFVAGETLDELVGAVRAAEERGFRSIANYLGEAVTDAAGARAAGEAYRRLLDRMHDEGLDVNVSVKLSQMGMDVSEEILRENLDAVLDRASRTGAFIRFDMESSAYTERTLDLFHELWEEGYRRIGIVVQAYLRRTAADLSRLIDAGASVRLCKGAYSEPSELAYQDPGRIRARFREGMARLLKEGHDPAIATHDEALIRDTLAFARREGIGPERFEFQLLYGVRRDLQKALLDRGHRVRVYIPYGGNWYPYLMRRLAERPENVLFMAGSMVKESPLGAFLPGRRGLAGEGEVR